ncbi:MAG: hypothetical protein ACXW1S_03730 [Acidimicrobiia bacterium]
MEKLVYLMWGDDARREPLRALLLAEVGPALLDAGARAVTVNVHDDAAAEAPAPVPTPDGEDPLLADVSVWVDAYDRRGPFEELLAGAGPEVAGYLVVESVYDDYGTTEWAAPRDWPDGQRSPGVLTVGLIHRPAGLGYHEWIQRWHGTQSPRSGELQPRTRYVRNEVVRALTPDAPEVHGIVEEGWPSAQHVADPMLFFNTGGDPAALGPLVEEMLANVNACLDLARFRSSTMSEYFVRSL